MCVCVCLMNAIHLVKILRYLPFTDLCFIQNVFTYIVPNIKPKSNPCDLYRNENAAIQTNAF